MPFRIEQLNVLNLATVGNSITAGSFVRSGGTSSQFLKADGTVDTNAYITGITSGMVTTALGYTPVPNTRNITINGVTQDLSADRSWTISAGVTSVSGSGAGISVSPTTGAVVVSNTGVTSNVAGTGISVSAATGAVTITNTGVTSIVAGTAISISGATGAVTINNTGVTSLNGSTGALTGFATQAWVTSQGYITSASVGNGTLTLNVSGNGLSGSQTFTANQSTAATFTVTSNATTAATANTLVYRDGSGHITGNYGFFAYVNTSDNDETGITRFVIKNGDNYHRSATTTTAMTIIRGVASGTWGIDISGNSATTTNFRHLGAGVNYDIDRTTKVSGGIAVYSGYSTGTNRPTTYDISAQFSVNGNMGMEIAADWISTAGPTLFARSLRDCCQNWSSWITLLTSLNYNSYSPTLTGGGASGTWSINITGSAGSASSASSVPWTGVTAGTRTNYDLRFQPPSNSYAGFEFNTSTGGGAGYFLVRGTSDNDVYTAEGITLVADAGWLTLAQRTTSDKGVRIMTGSTSTTRMAFNANGTTYLYTDLYLGSTNTRITASDATGYLRIYGSSGNYLAIGPYNNNGWVYFENISNSNGVYFNSPGRYAFDSVDVTPYNDAENSLGNGSYRWAQVYTSGWLRQYGAQGMYNQDYGTHFYSNGGSSWGITGSGGNIELQFRSNHQSTIRGYVYADTGNNIGFLNNSGSWSLRTDSSRNTILYGQLTVGQDIGYSSIYMYDSDEGTREIHCNSNRIGFLTQAGSWGAYLDDGTNWYSEGNIYAVAATARIQAGNSSSNDILYDSSRSALVARGNYPHVEIFAEVSNSNHGGTLRYTGYDNGSSGAYKSWNIGTAGSDLYFLDIGYGGTSNSNPHAGIAGLGSAYGYPNAFTAMRFHNNGNVGIGNFGTYGSLGTNTPAYKLDVRGTIYSDTDVRAPIFYDSDNTAYYLNPASSSTSLRIAGGIAQNNIVGRPAAYWGAGGGTTGAVVIKFPGNTGNYGMIHAVIDIYEYNGNDACTVIVGGHNWGGAWYNYGAQVVGSTDKPVRVGVKDGQYCIVIGNGSSSWSYGQVVLRKIQNGTYYSGVMDVAGGYTVAIESDTYSWISGDLRNLETPLNFYAGSNIYMGGNIVATQSWVNSQGFVTGGPFVPSRSQSNWNDGTVIGNTVGMLAWKNYGNGHVIFDASASTSPSGSGVNNTNSQIAWSSTYPTLMGWNGSNTYGVRVDSARISDNTSGNADTVDGYHASPSNIGNYIVVRDGNGYIFGNYINMTDDGNPGGGTSISSFITKQGDNYYRSVSPTNAMVSIRGVASGSWGINITGSSSSSTTASYLPTLYAGGVQSNPQVYFGQSIGLRVAMTGVPFAWCDTLWINGYSGGDVLSMTALHTARNGQPRMWLSTQSSNGTSYGTTYEFLTEWNYTNYTLPIGGGWYGVNMPGSRWGGYAVSGGEIVFGNGLPNAGQMGMLIDGAYVAGENNGFWSLPSNNDWNGRRGMYWDGSYLNFTANSPTSVFTTLRLANGFELQQGGSNYGQFNSWVHLPGFHGLYSGQNSAHIYPNNGSYGSWMMSGSRNGWQGIEFNSGSAGNVTMMVNTDSNTSGFHNNSYGWQIRWANGTLYVGKNSYGGNEATVLDSSNYTSYVSGSYVPISGGINMTGSYGLNDSRLYLRTNGDTNHYLWNAGDDWEELGAYAGTGFRVTSNNGANGLLYVYGSSNGGYTYSPYSFRAPEFRFTNSSNSAYLTGNSDWGFRVVNNDGYIQFGPANSGWAHIYSNLNFYMNTHLWISGGYKVTAWDYNNGGGDLYAVRYYDANDTGYYLDPNGTSELNQLTTGTRARWGKPRWWNNRQAFTSDQNYWTGTNGWGTGEGTWANAWRGGFSGWDIWGSGTDHPQGGGYIHAQGIVSGQHYATSDGSSGYGWMMVGAHAATDNRYWLRGKWGGGTSGWVEMITSGNIGSQNVNYASQAGTASFAANSGNTNSVSNATGGSYTWTAANYFQSNLGGYCGSLSGPPLQAYSTGNNSAFMSFHKGGYYAVNMGLDADSVLRIGGWSAAANRWQLDMSGNMTVAGDVTAYSDARVKENIETVEDALDKVLNLRGVYYNRTDSDDKRRKVGVIAQEILEVIPEVVARDNAGMYNVSYGNIVGVLIEAIKEQQKQIDELKARLN